MRKHVQAWVTTLMLVTASAGMAGPQGKVTGNAEVDARQVDLHITSRPLGDALSAFGQQSGLHVVLFSELGAGLTAPEINGKFTAAQALERLLRSSGLRYKFIDAQTVAVLGPNADLGAVAER